MDLRIETVVWDTRKLFNIKDDKFADQILSTTIQYLYRTYIVIIVKT